MRTYTTKKPFEGVITNIERRWKETDSEWVREELSRYQSDAPCEECKGFRLKPQALAVKIAGLHIAEVSRLSIRAANDWFATLPQAFSAKQNEIATRILKEIRERLRFLNDVGLDYLALSRNSGTLSGGESQRIRLASQIGSGLTGVLYVLDEPSIGLHQRDNARLLTTLKHLRDLGNSVLVVEHDEDAILYGRPCRRHRAGRRRAWRPHHRGRNAGRNHGARRTALPASILPASARSRCRPSGASSTSAASSPCAARAATTSRTSPPRSRSAASPA